MSDPAPKQTPATAAERVALLRKCAEIAREAEQAAEEEGRQDDYINIYETMQGVAAEHPNKEYDMAAAAAAIEAADDMGDAKTLDACAAVIIFDRLADFLAASYAGAGVQI